jgi:hypothetical protein
MFKKFNRKSINTPQTLFRARFWIDAKGDSLKVRVKIPGKLSGAIGIRPLKLSPRENSRTEIRADEQGTSKIGIAQIGIFQIRIA